MAKVLLTKTTQAATESLLQQLMPQFDKRLDRLEEMMRATRADITSLDAKVDNLRDEMLDRFERQRELINEVAHRVTRVEGKLQGYMEAMRGIVLPTQAPRRRKVG